MILAQNTTSGWYEFENQQISSAEMDIVSCTTHGKPCVLKTGTKPGLSHGKSFYICTQDSGQCQFVKQTSLKPKSCPNHPESLVELQSIVTSKSSSEQRCYYRCSDRTPGQKWCGYFPYSGYAKKSPLKDLNHQTPRRRETSGDNGGSESVCSVESGKEMAIPTPQEQQPELHKKAESVFKFQDLSKSESFPEDSTKNSSKMSVDDKEGTWGKSPDTEAQEKRSKQAAAVRHSTAMSVDEEEAFKARQVSGGSAKSSRKANLMSVGVFDKSAEPQWEDETKIDRSTLEPRASSDSSKPKAPVANLFSARNQQLIDLTSDSEDEQPGDGNVSMVDGAEQEKLHTDSFRRVQAGIVLSDDEDELVLNDSLPELDSPTKDSDLQRKLHTQSFRQMRDSSRRNDEDEEDIDSGKELFDSSEDDEYEDAVSEHLHPENNLLGDNSALQSSGPVTVPESSNVSTTSKNYAGSEESQTSNEKTSPPKNPKSAREPESDLPSTSNTRPSKEPEDDLPVLQHPKTATTTSSSSSSSARSTDPESSGPIPYAESQTAKILQNPFEQFFHPPPGLTQQLTKMKISGARGKSGAPPSLQTLLQERKKAMDELAREKQVMKMVALSSLPDNGARLQRRVEALEEKIRNLDVQIQQAPSHPRPHPLSQPPRPPQEVRVYPGGVHVPQGSQPPASRPPQGGMVHGAGKMGPPHPAVMVPLPGQPPAWMYNMPPHLLQQLYADNPQVMTLYGGRMTASRLREVGSITREALESLHKQLESCPPETAEMEDPRRLKVTLMTHQRQALAWLTWRERQNPPGGILADDMGLGKTLTMISLVLKQNQVQVSGTEEEKNAWLSRDKQLSKLGKGIVKSRATLVICPASLVHQWNKEIEKRCYPGSLRVCMYHGQNREKNVMRLADNDVVLTTYNLVAREVGAPKTESAEDPVHDDDSADSEEKSQKETNLLRIAWERIVLDEAHNVKNHKSQMSMAVCRLRANFRWALTGTPIQNDLLDMYSLLRFLRCSPFDEYKVWKRHVDTGKGTGATKLNTLIKALLLRRTKDQMNTEGKPLVSLPSRTVQIHEIELTAEERKIYDQLFAKTRLTVVDFINRHHQQGGASASQPALRNHQFQPASTIGAGSFSGGAGMGAMGGGVPMKPKTTFILVLLLRLRQCCSHLSLMKEHLEAESLETEGIELTLEEQMKGLGLEELAGKESQAVTASPAFHKSAASSKMVTLMARIQEVKENSRRGPRQKCVVVSQWTQMLAIVSIHLREANISHDFIQGNVAAKKRAELVEEFNHKTRGPDVMLVSLRAGGVGLNLIGANHLFLLDSHWNPALEDQACDRIYRMGQDKDVFIHRFLCKDTIEEKIVQLQAKKLDLAKNVLSGGEATSKKLSLDDLRLLFGV